MNSFQDDAPATIVARKLEADARMDMLPRHFGRAMMTVESSIFNLMGFLCPQYSGGLWAFYELSNGGCYMAPECAGRLQLKIEGNDFEGEMSADAAGITACLFALSHLSFAVRSEALAEHYHLLRDFALEHPDAGAILAAID